jgi:hypothetical protein
VGVSGDPAESADQQLHRAERESHKSKPAQHFPPALHCHRQRQQQHQVKLEQHAAGQNTG